MNPLSWPVEAIPRIAVAGRFPLTDVAHETRYRGVTHALHLHDYRGELRLGDETLRIAPGDLTLSPAGLVSSYALAAAGRHWCVHFAVARGAGETLALPLHLPAGDRTSAAREQLAHIAALHARAGDTPTAAAAASLSLQLFLLQLAEAATARTGVAERAAAAIDARFAKPLTVADIAAAVRASPAHLARAFKVRFGVTVPHRLLQRRVEHARYLLESTDLPIWRVAERVGIRDAQHFNKTVRRLTGLSPSAIRARSEAALVDPDR